MDLVNARLTTITLTILANDNDPANGVEKGLFIGVNGVGFSVNSATIAVASLKPPAPAQPSGTPDPRGWTAIHASVTGATFAGLGGTFSLTANSFLLKINQSSGGATPPAALDWSKVTGATLPAAITALNTRLLLVAGSVTIDIEGFVHVEGSFALEKGEDIFITREGETTTRKVSLMRLGISGGTVFAGVGTAQDGVGVSLTGVTLGLALMKDLPGVGTNSYTALKASGTASLVGVDALTLSGTLAVELNTATDASVTAPALPKAVDFTKLAGGKLDIKTGPLETDPVVPIDFATRVLRVKGSALITIDQFVFLRADFAFEKDDTPMTVSTSETTPKTGKVTALKIGATNGFAFFGIGGPYFNPDGTLRADANQAMGLAISNLTLGIALMKPMAGTDGGQLTGYKSFFALKASGNVALVGIDGFQASITNALVEINDASLITPGATPPPALNLQATPITVETGIGTPDVILNTNGRLL